MSASASQEGQQRPISARTEAIQSALEVQLRRLFERFHGKFAATTAADQSSVVEEEESQPTRPNLRGGATSADGKWKQRLSPLSDLLGLVRTAILAMLNAAVAIFGVGVGVGLILGDSFRGNAPREQEELEDDNINRTGRSQRIRGRGRRDRATWEDGGDDSGGGNGVADRPSLSTLPPQ